MRKIIAIGCLFIFISLQYGKIVSYWHCQMQAIASAVPCECEKILYHSGSIDAHTMAMQLGKEKADDLYSCYDPARYLMQPTIGAILHQPIYHPLVPASHLPDIFQPPRVS